MERWVLRAVCGFGGWAWQFYLSKQRALRFPSLAVFTSYLRVGEKRASWSPSLYPLYPAFVHPFLQPV